MSDEGKPVPAARTATVSPGPALAPTLALHDPRQEAALADLAFGTISSHEQAGFTLSKHLAFLPLDALDLDLDDPAQRSFGDYELIEKLGQGGMGVVYRARQRSLDREVAIKLLAAGPWASADFVERFRREAQSAARLQHPNIVAIHEIGSHEELNFFSMRLVRGQSLAGVLAESGPFDGRRAAALMRTVAEALDYAHRLGVLHLDLKPGNVLIDEQGTPWVADFGLARRLDEALAADAEEVSGTPSYMAPEQAQLRSHRLSPSTDIYGLGAILYELLTGRPPILGPTAQETLNRVLTQAPEVPSTYRPGIAPDLEAICLKCLAKEPGERYRSARELTEELGRFLEGRAVHVRPLSSVQRMFRWARREPRLALAISGAMLALLIGLLAAGTQWRRAEHQVSLVAEQSARSRLALWQQRRRAAWESVAAGRWLSALPALAANLAEQDTDGAAPEAALERLRIGLILDHSPRLIESIGTGEPVLAIAISPDGRSVAVAGTDDAARVRLIDLATGKERWRVDTADYPRSLKDYFAIQRLQFSADGTRLIATAYWPGPVINPPGFSTIGIDAADGRLLRPPGANEDLQELSFTPDGRRALLRRRDGTLQLVRTDDWTPLGARRADSWESGALQLSTDGAQFAVWAGNAELRLVDPLAMRTRHVLMAGPLPDPKRLHAWAFSPDGRWLAAGDGQGRVTLADTRSGALRELDPHPSTDITTLSFSADGAWLAAGSLRGEVHGWDVASGKTLFVPIWTRERAQAVRIDHGRRLVVAANSRRWAAWRVPDDGGSPTPEGPELARQTPNSGADYAQDVDFEHGLVATAANGELRVWRLPSPAQPLTARAPILPGGDFTFDGSHLVSVDGDSVRVIAATDGSALGAALLHPQVVHQAELVPGGNLLVTACGTQLRVWDWQSGALQAGPIELPGTPIRFALSPDGRRLALTWSEHSEAGLVEAVRSFDLADVSGAAATHREPGPLSVLRFSPDGSGLAVAQNSPGAPVRLLDARTLAPVPPLLTLPYPGTYAIDARFDRDGRELYIAMASSSDGSKGPHLLRADVRSGALRSQLALSAEPRLLALDSTGTRAALGAPARDLVATQGKAGTTRLSQTAEQAAIGPVAFSADGALVAQASRFGVLLADARTGDAVGPPLGAILDPADAIEQIAFAPDAGSVVARTHRGRWLRWVLRSDRRTAAAIALDAQRLGADPGEIGAALAQGATPEQRAQLRANDPGAWRDVGTDPSTPAETEQATQDPGTRAGMLDLSPWFNTPLRKVSPAAGGSIDLAALPTGRQRLLGVEFDIRGAITLSMQGITGRRPERAAIPFAVGPIPVRQRASAVHLLATSLTISRSRQHDPLAQMRLRYADGTDVAIPIRIGVDFDLHANYSALASASMRVAWLGANAVIMPDRAPYEMLFDVRAVNPHPEREIASLMLEATEVDWSAPLFVAATLEATPEGSP